jgi:hypothetical protein
MNLHLKTARIALILALLLAAACAEQKFYDWGKTSKVASIRVKTTAAVLRLTPDPNGEIAVDKVAAGTVFKVIRKTGAWYEVQHRSGIGVLLNAYIHESDVEAVAGPADKPPQHPGA